MFHCITDLLSTSFQKEDTFLDVPFTSELWHAVHKMKLNESSSPDNLSAEHLRHGGHSIVIWLTEILNFVVDTEHITFITETISLIQRQRQRPAGYEQPQKNHS